MTRIEGRFQRPPGIKLKPTQAPAKCPDTVVLSQPSEPPSFNWKLALGAGLALLPAAQAQAQNFKGFQHDLGHHHGGWDRQTTEGGWEIPRNTGAPVKPGFAIEVPRHESGSARVLDNTRGKIQALRLQWPSERDPRARTAHEAMFTDLLTRLDPDVKFEIVAEAGGTADLQALVNRLPNPERVRIQTLSLTSSREQWVQGMSMWSRDSSVTLTRPDGKEILLLPRSFRGDGTVDAYLNRVVIQSSGTAPALHKDVRRSELNFEGGDVIANGRHVLLSGATVRENARELKRTPEQIIEDFAREFGREVLVIDPEPDFHLDMGIGFLDDRTVTVGSPRLTEALPDTPEIQTMREASQQKGLQEKYDQAARQLETAGYRVVRLPNLAGKSLSTPYLSYSNVLLENYGNTKRVYMPAYNLPTDAAARAAYEKEGFEVIEIPAARESTRLAGAIRCAVSELDVAN